MTNVQELQKILKGDPLKSEKPRGLREVYLTAYDLRDSFPDIYEDWVIDVGANDTMLGFVEWVEHLLESEEEEVDGIKSQSAA